MSKKKLKRLQQLKKVRELYDCHVQCLDAVTYVVTNREDLTAEQIDSLWDKSKTCTNTTIREFICEIVPETVNFCVCADLCDKIKSLSVLAKTEVDCKKEEETKK